MDAITTEQQRRQFTEKAMEVVLQQAAHQSMQQRERIATACLAGLLAGTEIKIERVGNQLRFAPDADQAAALALAYADALVRRLIQPSTDEKESER